MSAEDLAFYTAALLALGGGLIVVAARRTPIANATGLVVSMTGVAGACALAGAPLIGASLLIVAAGVAVTVLLFALEWVGTGRDALAAPAAGRLAVRAFAVTFVLGLAFRAMKDVPVGWAASAFAAPEPGPPALASEALGARLYGGDPLVVGVCGLLLLVALLAGVTLAARRDA